MKKKEMQTVSLKVHFAVVEQNGTKNHSKYQQKSKFRLDNDYLRSKQFLLKIFEIVNYLY